MAQGEDEAAMVGSYIKESFEAAGFVVNKEKNHWEPS